MCASPETPSSLSDVPLEITLGWDCLCACCLHSSRPRLGRERICQHNHCRFQIKWPVSNGNASFSGAILHSFCILPFYVQLAAVCQEGSIAQTRALLADCVWATDRCSPTSQTVSCPLPRHRCREAGRRGDRMGAGPFLRASPGSLR